MTEAGHISAQRIVIAVMAFRVEPNRHLARWLKGRYWRYGSPECPVDVARNQTVKRFLEEDKEFDCLLMIDADMVPLAETEPILSVAGDVVFCGYVGAEGAAGHVGDANFGAACCRLSRRALEGISPPWFRFTTNAAHTVRTACECAHFRARAHGIGAEIRQVGIVGHLQPVILVPGPEGPQVRMLPKTEL
ncbi:MAG: hypothetical protein NTX87_10360 [Planctomycetota bacterium]|nr:hypothetical protein [Planctomycetota bacterium]